MKKFTHHKAINYSGYRQHQSPIYKKYPSKEEILEDLRLLEGEFYYLRLFDCTLHAYRVVELIKLAPADSNRPTSCRNLTSDELSAAETTRADLTYLTGTREWVHLLRYPWAHHPCK